MVYIVPLIQFNIGKRPKFQMPTNEMKECCFPQLTLLTDSKVFRSKLFIIVISLMPKKLTIKHLILMNN